MQVQVMALSQFVHGAYTMKRGEGGELPESIAADLEKVGLVKISRLSKPAEAKADSTLVNKMAAVIVNKAKK